MVGLGAGGGGPCRTELVPTVAVAVQFSVSTLPRAVIHSMILIFFDFF